MEYVYTMNLHHYHIQSPTEIVTTQLGIPQEYKQQCIKEVYRLGDSQNQQTNVKAIMSSYCIWEETKIFNQLLDKIIITLDKISPPFDPRFKSSLKEVWSTIYKKEHYTIPHSHTPSQISFVYYLQSSGDTPLIFNDCNFQINPIDDMLIIFPSYLVHSVPKHIGKEDRVCIAGNLDWEIKET
jgi:hypothetical protein